MKVSGANILEEEMMFDHVEGIAEVHTEEASAEGRLSLIEASGDLGH